jgi:YfiR/HmsC-like
MVMRAFGRRRIWAAATLTIALFNATHLRASQQIHSADDVKAAFLFNFVKFVEWPIDAAPSSTPLVIGVVGSDGIEESLLATIGGKAINGRPLTVKRLSGADDVTRVHLLFVGSDEKGRVTELLRRVDGISVLTVSDADRFCQSGGVIGLLMEDNRVRFDVNLDAADRGRLKVSSKLLALARHVRSSSKVSSGDR